MHTELELLKNNILKGLLLEIIIIQAKEDYEKNQELKTDVKYE